MGQLSLEFINNMTQDEKRFCRELGERIAQLRKEQGLTQGQLAELLGVSQQSVAVYEVGRLRVAVSMLPRLAKVLGVSVEGLIGEEEKPVKRGPTPKLQRHMERISELPKTQQRFLLQMIETALAQAGSRRLKQERPAQGWASVGTFQLLSVVCPGVLYLLTYSLGNPWHRQPKHKRQCKAERAHDDRRAPRIAHVAVK